ncbi:ubiquitin-protein ligase E3 [Cyathus striatus]|nr:ubiquitin-protein ligase E3 [Cyathus striatus]
MDVPLKELDKLENVTAPEGKDSPVLDTLNSLLRSLGEIKQSLESDGATSSSIQHLQFVVDAKKRTLDERQKEAYSCMVKFGKSLDKKFTSSLPAYTDLFSSESSKSALERTIALHFLRTGHFDIAETFIDESGVNISESSRTQFEELHGILKALRDQDITPALDWAKKHRPFLQSRGSPLEFYLHRSRYLHLLFSSYPPDPLPAIRYAQSSLQPFFVEHETEFKRLMASVAYLPIRKLQDSPYADLASPSMHFDLVLLFAKEYCASLGMSRQVPLRVVGDIGGGGALARIEKGRKVMRERKSEWSQTDELPIEIPLPPENRYHSIFACPVSKEQSTETNPPMMMACGHVISKDSLHKLGKPGGRVKCPYCPTESTLSNALRVYF